MTSGVFYWKIMRLMSPVVIVAVGCFHLVDQKVKIIVEGTCVGPFLRPRPYPSPKNQWWCVPKICQTYFRRAHYYQQQSPTALHLHSDT